MSKQVSSIGSSVNMVFKAIAYIIFPILNGAIMGVKAHELQINICCIYMAIVHSLGFVAFAISFRLNLNDQRKKEKEEKENIENIEKVEEFIKGSEDNEDELRVNLIREDDLAENDEEIIIEKVVKEDNLRVNSIRDDDLIGKG